MFYFIFLIHQNFWVEKWRFRFFDENSKMIHLGEHLSIFGLNFSISGMKQGWSKKQFCQFFFIFIFFLNQKKSGEKTNLSLMNTITISLFPHLKFLKWRFFPCLRYGLYSWSWNLWFIAILKLAWFWPKILKKKVISGLKWLKLGLIEHFA